MLTVNGEVVPIDSVRQLLDKLQDDVPWSLRLKIALEMARGVSYLHEAECVHCDLKTANVFVGSDEKNEWKIQIGDFGEARSEHKDALMSQMSFQDPTSHAGGTVPFIAPEVLKGGCPTKQSDIYIVYQCC